MSGYQLTDARGNVIRLLGVDRSGAEYGCVQNLGVLPGPTGAGQLAAMLSWRINAVRLPLNEDCWLGINGVPARYGGERYRAAVHGYVARLNRAGLYVILDLHWNAPGSQLATGQQPMADLDHAPSFWSSVATTFRADPAVIFDLYNEPHGISWHCWQHGCLLPAGWRAAGMQTLVNAVRAVGASQPVIATGLGSGNDLSSWLAHRPHDPAGQLVAGFHVYSWQPCAAAGCWTRQVAPIARRVPVIAAEVGAAPCAGAFLADFLHWADRAGVSYLGWSWNPGGCSSPALITSWDDRPTESGAVLRTHLIRLRPPN